MLQINSKYAEQKVTIQCKNVQVTPTFEGFKYGDVFTPDQEDDNMMVELKTIQNGCSVCYNNK